MNKRWKINSKMKWISSGENCFVSRYEALGVRNEIIGNGMTNGRQMFSLQEMIIFALNRIKLQIEAQ